MGFERTLRKDRRSFVTGLLNKICSEKKNNTDIELVDVYKMFNLIFFFQILQWKTDWKKDLLGIASYSCSYTYKLGHNLVSKK